MAGGALWGSRPFFLRLVEPRTWLCSVSGQVGDWSETPNPANASIFPQRLMLLCTRCRTPRWAL